MKNSFSITSLAFLALFAGCQEKVEGDLYRVVAGEFDEIGESSGYVNVEGDTIIPIGKYQYCYTDTFQNFAIVLLKDGRCVGIDRNEQELFEVFWYDNGPDYPQEGLFRIKKDGKIGYANEKGQVVVEPQFKCAWPFEEGKAKVALNCDEVKDFEHSSWESEEWFYINRQGDSAK